MASEMTLASISANKLSITPTTDQASDNSVLSFNVWWKGFLQYANIPRVILRKASRFILSSLITITGFSTDNSLLASFSPVWSAEDRINSDSLSWDILVRSLSSKTRVASRITVSNGTPELIRLRHRLLRTLSLIWRRGLISLDGIVSFSILPIDSLIVLMTCALVLSQKSLSLASSCRVKASTSWKLKVFFE